MQKAKMATQAALFDFCLSILALSLGFSIG
jgi:hypothetical protein